MSDKKEVKKVQADASKKPETETQPKQTMEGFLRNAIAQVELFNKLATLGLIPNAFRQQLVDNIKSDVHQVLGVPQAPAPIYQQPVQQYPPLPPTQQQPVQPNFQKPTKRY